MARRAVEALLEVLAEPASSTDELLARLLDAGRELAKARPAMGGITRPLQGQGLRIRAVSSPPE